MFFTALIGAAIGAIVGAAISVGMQLAQGKTIHNLDWRAVAGSAAQGAVTGGVAGLTLGAGALIPALGTRIAVAAGTGVVGGLLGLGASSAITGKAPTKGQIISTVVASALGGGIGGAFVGPAASTVLTSVPRVVALGAGTGGLAGGAGQLAEEAATGFQPGAGGRIAQATGIGAAAGVGGAGLGVGAGRALPAPVRAASTEVTPTGSTSVEPTTTTLTPTTQNPILQTPTTTPEVTTSAAATGNGGPPPSSIGIKGALEKLAVGDGGPAPTDGHAASNGQSGTPTDPTGTQGESPTATGAAKSSPTVTTAAQRARPGPTNPEGSRRAAAPATEAPPEEAAPARATTEPETYADWKKAAPPLAHVDPLTDLAYYTREVPALEQQLATIREQGYQVKYGEPGKGSWCNSEKVPPEIVIDPQSTNPVELLKTLAHEVGHALEKPTPFRDPRQLSRADYVAQRVQDMAASEGQAVLNEAQTLEAFRQAVRMRTGTSPDMPYQGQYRVIALNKGLTADQKVAQIGSRYMEQETPSVYAAGDPNAPNYNEHWATLFGEAWDEAHGLTSSELAAPGTTPSVPVPAAPVPH